MEDSSRIEVTLHKTSDKHFCELIGRFICMSISSTEKSFRLFDGEQWYMFKTTEHNINRIKELALRDKGSLYVKIKGTGLGYVIDEPLR